MRVLVDESVIRAYAIELVEAGHDVTRAVDDVGEGVTDEELHAHAERTDTVLLTADTTVLSRRPDHGVIVDARAAAPTMRLASAVDDIEAAYDDHSAIREVVQAWD